MADQLLSDIGSVNLICGPMFSGKTSELLTRLRIANAVQKRTLLIRFKEDDRYGDGVETHDRIKMPETTAFIAAGRLSEVDVRDYEVIGIDEGQFFPDLAECESWADRGQVVIISALSGDYKQEPFPIVSGIIPMCDTITTKCSICMKCRARAAPFTIRTFDSDKQCEIGGAGKYKVVCRKCLRLPN